MKRISKRPKSLMDNLKELDIHEQGYSQESIDKLTEAFSNRKIEINNGHNI